ncbi:PREDICTED: uncharacterized protein LOC106807674 [Priapulus caudatus]|uniref:Uncharacterized protein LOC106807674 n=1 Tax=Priapulus caudatus TaxID=37621 RepID=A0ABM1E059_PRICU|nr:PREDICTED: uncharacterized protein LOC106807674 [Priapulus caudatus]
MICASWVVMRDVVGSARYTDACALRQFLEAPILFVAPMILGAAYDSKQGTRPVFTIIGVLMLLSAAIAVPLPILTRRREKKLREGDSADTVAAEAESSDSSEEESEDAFFDGMPSNVVIM